MSEKYLQRDDAPFGDAIWATIDKAAIQAARDQLTARRLIHIEGPFGLSLKGIPSPDKEIEAKAIKGVNMQASGFMPLAMLRTNFTLSARDIAFQESTGYSPSLAPIAQAAIKLARQEDTVLFNGLPALELTGLLNSRGTHRLDLKPWDEIGVAVENIIDGVTKLDDAGFHGPYSLALAPVLYNKLFRRYPDSNLIEIEHLRSVVTDGIVKAAALSSGGVLMASGPEYATIVIGQDMMAGFIGPEDEGYEFFLSETIALNLRRPDSVCVLM